MLKKLILFCLVGLIQLYRWLLSPFFGRQCRFQPTCSVYAQQALHMHGPVKGIVLTFHRLRRCHPLQALGAPSGFTYDPVPPSPPIPLKNRV